MTWSALTLMTLTSTQGSCLHRLIPSPLCMKNTNFRSEFIWVTLSSASKVWHFAVPDLDRHQMDHLSVCLNSVYAYLGITEVFIECFDSISSIMSNSFVVPHKQMINCVRHQSAHPEPRRKSPIFTWRNIYYLYNFLTDASDFLLSPIHLVILFTFSHSSKAGSTKHLFFRECHVFRFCGKVGSIKKSLVLLPFLLTNFLMSILALHHLSSCFYLHH